MSMVVGPASRGYCASYRVPNKLSSWIGAGIKISKESSNAAWQPRQEALLMFVSQAHPERMDGMESNSAGRYDLG